MGVHRGLRKPLLQPRQKLDDIPQFATAQFLVQIVRHRTLVRLLAVHVVHWHFRHFAFGIDDCVFLIRLRPQHSANRATVGKRQDHAFEALCNLFVRIDDRFEQVISGFVFGDLGNIRADLAALTVELVATLAIDGGIVEKNLFAFSSRSRTPDAG